MSDQSECNLAFGKWANVLTNGARPFQNGWIIESKGVYFTNYGHGEDNTIEDQIMLGVDPDTNDSTVKIVRPKGARNDKGPATVLAKDEVGRRFLLREGRLTANRVSGFIRDEFTELTGLHDVPLMIKGKQSTRRWYVVAELDAPPAKIIKQTADFSNACARARARAGGGKEDDDQKNEDSSRPTFGMDEKGRIVTRNTRGGTFEVRELQGYVFQALKRVLGKKLQKPKRNGYCVDGMIASANLLIEIKTGTSAHCVYEAVGQLKLYPSLIGIEGGPEKALLIPDNRPLKPIMVAALDAANISVFTYNIDDRRTKPRITFPDAFIERCEGAAN